MSKNRRDDEGVLETPEQRRRREQRERIAMLDGVRITNGQLRQAMWLVDNSSVVDDVQDQMTARTGCPQTLPWRIIFVGLVLATMQSSATTVYFTVAARALTSLTNKQRHRLGLGIDFTVEHHHLWGPFTKLCHGMRETIDLDTGEVLPPRVALTEHDIANGFIRTTNLDALVHTGHLAIDSTDHSTFARIRVKSCAVPGPENGSTDDTPVRLVDTAATTSHYVDPVSGRSYPYIGEDGRKRRTPAVDATDGYASGKNHQHFTIFAGFDLHIGVDVGVDGRPALASAIEVAHAGSHKGDAGRSLITRVSDMYGKVTDLYADRGYSHTDTDTWARWLIKNHISQHHDLHANEARIAPTNYAGVTMVDGHPFVTAMPKRLKDLRRPALGATRAEIMASAAAYDERKPYAFTKHSVIGKEGTTIRYRGPAVTGQVRCENWEASMRLGDDKPITNCPASGCSCGKVISINIDGDVKHRQPLLYGTSEWVAAYGRRNHVESFNASLKSNKLSLSRKSIAVLSKVKVSILLGIVVAVCNMRILQSRYGVELGDDKSMPTPGEKLEPIIRDKRGKLLPYLYEDDPGDIPDAVPETGPTP